MTGGKAHLHGLVPGQHSFEETSQEWRAVGDTVSNFTDRGRSNRTQCRHRLATPVTFRRSSKLCCYVAQALCR